MLPLNTYVHTNIKRRRLHQEASIITAVLIAMASLFGIAYGSSEASYITQNNHNLSNIESMMLGVSDIPKPPINTTNRYRMVDSGGTTTCAIRIKDGGIECYGLNQFGQASPPKGEYKYLSIGDYHGCALNKNDNFICWGLESSIPNSSQTKGRYKKVVAGSDHTCAINHKKQLLCWGNNDFQETTVPPGKYKDVSAKGDHTCAINEANKILCWGESSFSTYLPKDDYFIDVTTGRLHGCGILKSNSETICWGNNAYGQSSPPSGQFVKLVSGSYHTCGQRKDKTVECWGNSDHGQAFNNGLRYKQISAGGNLTCGLQQSTSKLDCQGSFANNNVLYSRNNISSVSIANTDISRPQFAFNSFFGGAFGLFDGLVSNGLDIYYEDKWSTKGKWKAGAMGASLLGFFLGEFLPGESDPNEERYLKIIGLLEDLRVDIAEVRDSLEVVKNLVNSGNYMVAANWCDNSVAYLSKAKIFLTGSPGPISDMQKILNNFSELSTDIQQKRKTVDDLKTIFADIRRYKENYTQPKGETGMHLSKYRETLTLMLTGDLGTTSPLQACMAKSYQLWKSKENLYPFDDRPIWKEAYNVMIQSMAVQSNILNLELQLHAFDFIEKLLGERNDADGKGIPQIVWTPQLYEGDIEGSTQGLCLQAEVEKEKPGANPRWKDLSDTKGMGPCQQLKATLEKAYVGQVEQLEAMGGAYSDEDVVLSMTSQQAGITKTTPQSNWLWFRRPSALSSRELLRNWKISGTSIISPVSAKKDRSGFANSFPLIDSDKAYITYLRDDKGFGEAVWHSNGQAWKDVFQARQEIKDESMQEKDRHEDFVEEMGGLGDTVNNTCKKKIDGSCETLKWTDPENPNNTYLIPVPDSQNKLFDKVTGIPFHMPVTSESTNYPFLDWMQSSKGENQGEVYGGGSLISRYVKQQPPCFIASGINKPNLTSGKPSGGAWYHPLDRAISDREFYNEDKRDYLKLSGKVCNREEFSAFLVYSSSNLGWLNGVDCRNSVGSQCTGIGFSAFDSDNFKPYKPFFYPNTPKLLYQNTGSNSYLKKYSDYGFYVENFAESMYFYHMPVVNVSKRTCRPIRIGKLDKPSGKYLHKLRSEARLVEKGVSIPSICGEDLDKLIDRLAPRPAYLSIPEIDN